MTWTGTAAMKLRFLHRAYKARFRDQGTEIRALTGALGRSDVGVDVGANKGSYLLWLSRAASRGRVVAFEPQPGLAAYLARVCEKLGLANVEVEACGVSNAPGSAMLHMPGGAESPGASFESATSALPLTRSIEVPLVTLDGHFAGESRRIAAMKIDVEGHELSVLQGGVGVLREHGPLLVVECEDRHSGAGHVSVVLDFLRSMSYDGHFVHRSRLVPISEFRPEVHQRQIGENFERSKDYCNNFVLTKRQGA